MESNGHIGEYIRTRLKEEGRTIAWLAELMKMSRQNLSGHYLNKAEILPSHIDKFKKILGDDFFNDYEGLLPESEQTTDVSRTVEDSQAVYTNRGSGYKVTIEIDPLNFEPQMLDSLSTNLRNALENFRLETERGEKGSKKGREGTN